MILVVNPLSPSTIATLLGLRPQSVFSMLSSARSLLILHDDVDYPVRPFHKSFPDFITDPNRCTNRRFHISPPDHHAGLLINCLNLMKQTLERSMCKFPDAVLNSEVSNLKERIGRYISPYEGVLWAKYSGQNTFSTFISLVMLNRRKVPGRTSLTRLSPKRP
jgi:hypothetical protein